MSPIQSLHCRHYWQWFALTHRCLRERVVEARNIETTFVGPQKKHTKESRPKFSITVNKYTTAFCIVCCVYSHFIADSDCNAFCCFSISKTSVSRSSLSKHLLHWRLPSQSTNRIRKRLHSQKINCKSWCKIKKKRIMQFMALYMLS